MRTLTRKKASGKRVDAHPIEVRSAFAYRDESSWAIPDCPYCHEGHVHGAPNDGAGPGSRWPHCGEVYGPTSYVLVEVRNELDARMRQAERQGFLVRSSSPRHDDLQRSWLARGGPCIVVSRRGAFATSEIDTTGLDTGRLVKITKAIGVRERSLIVTPGSLRCRSSFRIAAEVADAWAREIGRLARGCGAPPPAALRRGHRHVRAVTGARRVSPVGGGAMRPRVPGYTHLLLAYAATLPKGKPRVVHVTALHDDGCSLLARRGPCDCDPELETTKDAS